MRRSSGFIHYAAIAIDNSSLYKLTPGSGGLRAGGYGARQSYGPLAASGYFRRAIGAGASLGLSGEAGAGLVAFGGELQTLLFDRAELSLRGHASHLASAIGTDRLGGAVDFDLRSVRRDFSIELSGRAVTRGYNDLASAAGDPPPPGFVALQLNAGVGAQGWVSFAAIRESYARDIPGRTHRQSSLRLAWQRNAGPMQWQADGAISRRVTVTVYLSPNHCHSFLHGPLIPSCDPWHSPPRDAAGQWAAANVFRGWGLRALP